jgi:hypothetical protein
MDGELSWMDGGTGGSPTTPLTFRWLKTIQVSWLLLCSLVFSCLEGLQGVFGESWGWPRPRGCSLLKPHPLPFII